MSFWNLSDNTSAATTAQETFETPTGGQPIPNNTLALAMIDEASWDERDGVRFISLRWSVLKPEEVKNRKVYQKLYVADANPQTPADKVAKKRDRAKQMLATIDLHCGGKMAKVDTDPSDNDLTSCLANNMMVIRVMEWESEDGQASGNWVAGVYPKSESTAIGKALPKKSYTAPQTSVDLDDDIPF